MPQPPRTQGFVVPPCPSPATFLLANFPPLPNNTFQPLPDHAPFPVNTISPLPENTFPPLLNNAHFPVNANPAFPNHAGHVSLPMAPRAPHPDRERLRHTGPASFMPTHTIGIDTAMASLQPSVYPTPLSTQPLKSIK